MGFVKDAKAKSYHREAVDARNEGRMVFMLRIRTAVTDPGVSMVLDDVAQYIEAVEAAGWWLVEMSYTQDKNDKPTGFFMFRPQRQ